MKVMVLSPHHAELEHIIRTAGDETYIPGEDTRGGCHMAVMYGHREILTPAQIEQYPVTTRGGGVINIHNSFLPYNRGASPNFWSWYEGTPKGVSIHQVDSGIDTGPILAQERYYSDLGKLATLRNTYNGLHHLALELFARKWKFIRLGIMALPQDNSKATFHKKKDLEPIWPLLPSGWDTSVDEVIRLGNKARRGW